MIYFIKLLGKLADSYNIGNKEVNMKNYEYLLVKKVFIDFSYYLVIDSTYAQDMGLMDFIERKYSLDRVLVKVGDKSEKMLDLLSLRGVGVHVY